MVAFDPCTRCWPNSYTSGRHEDESAETPVLKAKGSRFLSEFSMQIYFASDTGVEAMWKNESIATSKRWKGKESAYWKNMIHFCVDILPGHHTKSREYCQVEEKKKAQVVTAKEEKFGKLRDRFVWHTSSQPNESKEYLLQNMAAKHHVLQ